MKKFFTIIVMVVMFATLLTGCNKSYGFGNYSFKKVHVDTFHNSDCFTIEKWYENESGIEVKTKEAGFMFLSEGTYMLIEKKCPFCTNDN